MRNIIDNAITEPAKKATSATKELTSALDSLPSTNMALMMGVPSGYGFNVNLPPITAGFSTGRTKFIKQELSALETELAGFKTRTSDWTIGEWEEYSRLASEAERLREIVAAIDYEPMTWQMKMLQDSGVQAADALAQAFAGWAVDTKKNIGEVADELKNRLLAMLAEIAAKYLLLQAIGMIPGAGPFAFLLGKAWGMSAKGNAFDGGGRMQRFQFGGIVDRPTGFGMRGGMGMMGEAGPEAILPLTRNKRGELVVKTESAFNPSIAVYLDGREIRHSVQRLDRFDSERGV